MKLSKSAIERATAAFADLAVGDPRRKQRVIRTVERLASNPGLSFPEAMGNEADIEGGYRLMNSSRVTMEDLNEAHAGVTAARAIKAKCVLAIHDSTTCEFAHADPERIGYTSTGGAGFIFHYALVVARADLAPLGIAFGESVVRHEKPRSRNSKTKRKRKRSGKDTVRDPNRESLRWNRGFAAVDAALSGAEVIHLADREGDNYGLLAQAIGNGSRFVIRARVLTRRVKNDEGELLTLGELVEGATGKLQREVELAPRRATNAALKGARASRAGRLANLEFSAARVVMPRPRTQPASAPAQLEFNVVRVSEPEPPAGQEPIEWVLFTSEPVDTAEQVAAVVDMYRARWLIEECNKAIKTGCRYEERQFESLDALLTLLALTLPIACELLALRAACRRAPDEPASRVLTETQLQILAHLGSRALPPRPTVHDALWAVAALGGHMKTNGEPGWLVLYRGMAKLLAYEKGWRARWAAREKRPGLSISR